MAVRIKECSVLVYHARGRTEMLERRCSGWVAIRRRGCRVCSIRFTTDEKIRQGSISPSPRPKADPVEAAAIGPFIT